jgi:ABC-type lipoprotein export system ATPase subunit
VPPLSINLHTFWLYFSCADEPTGNLDRENTEIFLNLVKELQKEMQLTVVVATHNPYISKWGDRTLFLEDGILRCL